MTEVQLLHTAHLDAAVLASVRALLDDAFAGGFSEDDWEHCLGGHAGTLMAALEDVVRRAHDAGALSASAQGAPLYDARGWAVWRGPTSALTPTGVVRTPGDDGSVRVPPVTATLDLDGEITCDWRDGDLW